MSFAKMRLSSLGAPVVAACLVVTPAGAVQAQAIGANPGIAPASALFKAQNAICRPTLYIDGRPRRSGTAFLLQTSESKPRLLLVMAQHLAGMANTAGEIPWAEMPARAQSASCQPLDGGAAWRTGPAFAIEGAHAMGPLSALKDIAVFPVIAGDRQTELLKRSLTLALAAPQTGRTVWLVARLNGPAPPDELLHPATVVAGEGPLAYVYRSEGLELSNTSGAPVIDEAGRVVGVNVAVGHQGATTFGIADGLQTVFEAVSGAGR